MNSLVEDTLLTEEKVSQLAGEKIWLFEHRGQMTIVCPGGLVRQGQKMAFIEQHPLYQEIAQGNRSAVSAYLAKLDASKIFPGLMTGYYSPQLTGSLEPSSNFQVPLFPPLPESWLKEPRRVIDHHWVELSTHALCWLKDPVQAFMLEVQGGGLIDLGAEKRWVTYVGRNAHAYQSLGAWVRENRSSDLPLLKKMTLTQYLQKQSDVRHILNQNPSKIFFDWSLGPRTACDMCPEAFSTVAVDPIQIPLGSFVQVQTVLNSGKKINYLAFATDTGAAIQGAHRVDLYVGVGEGAGVLSAYLMSKAVINPILINQERDAHVAP